MMCERSAQVHAYHDGELTPAQVVAVEAHLRDCGPCAALLAELRRVSALVAAAPMVDLPPQAMKRMQQAWWAAQDRGVLRVASWLTAAAAAIIFGVIMLTPGPTQRIDGVSSGSLAVWMQPPAELQEPADEPQDELLIATQWIADDLSLAEAQ